MSNNRTAYPLSWPPGWPKTEPLKRQSGQFKQTLAAALANLKRQIELMGGKNVLLSSNYTLGHDNPKESGVCAYFEYEGQQMAIPCDRWHRIEHNIQAIALTVEAMRGMERWGAKHMIKAMFSGFKALPDIRKPWHEVLGVPPNACSADIKQAYRQRSKAAHPDVGGSDAQMAEVNAAYEIVKQLGLVF